MTSGIYIYNLGGSNSIASKCLIQSDGKILVIGSALGNFSVIRLGISGILDTSFGNSGNVIIDFGANDIALSGLIQNDGKIIITGSYGWGTPSSDFALVRLLINGDLDSSFGKNGKVTFDFAQYDTADSIALQADGKIVIGGHTYYQNNDDFVCARINADGKLDTNFAFGGITNTDLGSRDLGYSIISLPDKSILLVGESGLGVGIVKYAPNGNIDINFGQTGRVIFSNLQHSATVKIATTSDGKIFIASDVIVSRIFGFAGSNSLEYNVVKSI
jgi:uncharacterized delta-60 repeat protein